MRTCAQCGASFAAHNPQQRYCGSECRYQADLKRRRDRWAADVEGARALARERRARRRDALNAWKRNYYEQRREDEVERRRNKSPDQRERDAERTRRWYAEHGDYARARAADRRAAKRGSTIATASRQWQKWTPEEDAVALDPTLTPLQVALLTQRTAKAVEIRRTELRRMSGDDV